MKYSLHHVDGLKFDLLPDSDEGQEYGVLFYDNKSKETLYQTVIKPNSWAKLNRRYLSDIHIIVKKGNKEVKRIKLLDEIRGKKVFINFESKALGDTIAWMPYCEEFRKFYNCKVVVSTFHNYLFEKEYKNIEFVGRGVVVHNIVGMYDIGWFYDREREPTSPNMIPLQQAASNILNLPHKEIVPEIDFIPSSRPIEGKYVCISTESTARLKYWDYWQDMIDFLNMKGYKVVEVSKGETPLNNLYPISDKSLKNVMNLISHSDFFMGLSSGLSWLAWALKKRVYMIANFSNADHEFTSNCVRITNTDVCHGCWNNPLFKFNRGDFYWCPEHEDTPMAFQCHKSITPDMVIKELVLRESIFYLNQ